MADKKKSPNKDAKSEKGKAKKDTKAPKAKDLKGKDAKVKEPKVKAPKKDKGKKGQKVEAVPQGYVPRLQSTYHEQIVPALQKQFGIKNPMLVPRLSKIVLNVGIGTLHSDSKLADSIVEELGLISGQKAVLTKARKSIANFKLRDGMVVGCRVTLRKARMYEFFDRLIGIVIPRIRDFRGLKDSSFDGRGNYNFGIREQIVFPEIDYDNVVKIHGMDITIATTAQNDEQALELMRGFGFPFKRPEEEEAAA